jgi:hypothetical protein
MPAPADRKVRAFASPGLELRLIHPLLVRLAARPARDERQVLARQRLASLDPPHVRRVMHVVSGLLRLRTDDCNNPGSSILEHRG